MSEKCKKCGRKLTDPESIERGYGPQCWAEVSGESIAAEETIIPGQMDIFDFLGSEPPKVQGKICPICGKIYRGRGSLSRKDNHTEICPACGADEAIDALKAAVGDRATPEYLTAIDRMKREVREIIEKGAEHGRVDGSKG